jgi:hypothetical protein
MVFFLTIQYSRFTLRREASAAQRLRSSRPNRIADECSVIQAEVRSAQE